MESKVVDKNIEFDATHSWNGFCYQGKVAIIAVIDYMINSIGNIELINQYSLEFEYLEDFSILKNEDYVQIHQVKSYGVDSLSNYRDAIWLLLGKSVYDNYKTITRAYLHTAERIESNGKTLLDIATLREALIASKAPSSSKSKTQMSPFELYKYVEDNNLLDDAFKKLSIYEYSNGDLYCTLLNIEELSKKKIEEYFEFTGKKQDLEQKGLLNDYKESVYVNLLGFIDKHINYRHFHRQKGTEDYEKEINLIEIHNILTKDYEKLPKSLYIYYLKDKLIQNFNNYYNEKMEFIREGYLDSNNGEEILKDYRNLEKGLNKVLDLIKRVYTNFDEEEFLLLCHKINPHIVLDFKENFINLGELVSYRFMSYPWFQALVDFHESIADENLSINMNKSSYLATTIAHTIQLPDPKDSPFYQKQINAHIEAAISEIAINILENNMIYKELYKVDFIITGNINKPLNDYINKVTVTKEYEKSHILSIKDIHLIELNECRLKGEDKDE